MGQRTFRAKLADTLVKEYVKPKPQAKISEIDVTYEFDLDFPINNIQDNKRGGIINSFVSKDTKIRNLYLTIMSKNFGEGKSYLHKNLNILFGAFFVKDISQIYIKLVNPNNGGVFDDRDLIIAIIELMVFKKKKVVIVNDKFYYRIVPGFQEFSIVLTYRDNLPLIFDSKKGFETFKPILFQDLIYHSYSEILFSFEALQKCKLAINKAVPKSVNNIVLPQLKYNYKINNNFKEPEFLLFLEFLKSKFEIVSLEIKLLDMIKDVKYMIEIMDNFASNFHHILKEFKYLVVVFNFNNFQDLEEHSSIFNQYSMNYILRKILKKHFLQNLSLGNHVSIKSFNKKSKIEDKYEKYDFAYYDNEQVNEVYLPLFAIKKAKVFANKKPFKKTVLNNFLEMKNGLDYRKRLLTDKSFDFSCEIIENRKIVQVDINSESLYLFPSKN